MAVLRAGEPVDDFVDGAIAAAGDNELAAGGAGAPGDIGSFAGAAGLLQIGTNAPRFQNAPGGVEFCPACRASTAGVGVVNQESVMKFLHRWAMRSCPQRSRNLNVIILYNTCLQLGESCAE